MNPSRYWRNDFDDAIPRRVRAGEPDWGCGSKLPRSVVESLQKFQVGESGDGAHLIAKADSTGDTDYAHAVRLFVAEERNHARMLEELLCVAGAVPIDRHWSDAVFVRLRRSMGLRMEIMILAIAEVIALRYYRALAEGDDALLTEVAERILADEVRHVPFQCHRLRVAFARTPTWQRAGIAAAWRGLALAVSALVAVDHGGALRDLGVGKWRFVLETRRLFADASDAAFGQARELADDGLPTSRQPAGVHAG